MSLWNRKRVERYINLYGDPRAKIGTQSQLCKDVSEFAFSLPQPVQSESILDVGCGLGNLIPFLPSYLDYLGLDLSKDMLHQAQDFFPEKTFSHKDATNFLISNRFFNYVISISMFIHLTEKQARDALRCMWDHLDIGGTLVFGMETNGDSVTKRESGLIIRNQSVENVLAMLNDVIPVKYRVHYQYQRIVYQTISDFTYSKSLAPSTLISHQPIARTTLFKVQERKEAAL